MRFRIFVVEDDESIREMIRMALTSFSYDVVTFDNAEDALTEIYRSAPDLIVLDIMLPEASGLDATRRLRKDLRTKDLPVILLTAKDTELDKVAGLDCGADDYMTKPFGVMELGARVRSLLRRATAINVLDEDISVGALSINRKTREVKCDDRPLDLTFKEYELICLLVRERARVVPREELIHDVWGYDFVGESRTLDMHIRALRRKLGDDADRPAFIKTVRNVGYRYIGGQA